ncbi:MAG: hypothetical protein WC565_09485 [Parcubacteria group bacterium]
MEHDPFMVRAGGTERAFPNLSEDDNTLISLVLREKGIDPKQFFQSLPAHFESGFAQIDARYGILAPREKLQRLSLAIARFRIRADVEDFRMGMTTIDVEYSPPQGSSEGMGHDSCGKKHDS